MPRAPKNRVTMTDLWLRRLKTETERQEYVDAATPGLAIRVYDSGAKTWHLRYRLRTGQEKRMVLGNYPAVGLADARDRARQELARVARGMDPQREKQTARDAETFGWLTETYLEHARREKRSWKEDERILRSRDLASWRACAVREIRRADVARVLERIVQRAPIMANRTRALLSRILNYAVELEVIEHNPVAGTRPPARERKRDRVLSGEEIRALWAVWEQEASIMSTAFQILLLTAQRENEALSLRWTDLDLKARIWTIPAGISKNRRAHRVHLAEPVLMLLEQLRPRTGGSEWVFESPKKPGTCIVSINNAANRYGDQAGVEDWHPHDLRRTAATGMAILGTAESVIGRVLNHSPRGVTAAVYIRAGYSREMAAALEDWAAHMMETVGALPEARLAAGGSAAG